MLAVVHEIKTSISYYIVNLLSRLWVFLSVQLQTKNISLSHPTIYPSYTLNTSSTSSTFANWLETNFYYYYHHQCKQTNIAVGTLTSNIETNTVLPFDSIHMHFLWTCISPFCISTVVLIVQWSLLRFVYFLHQNTCCFL